MVIAEWIVNLLAAYAACGVLFAIAFMLNGIDRVDPIAKASTVGFRIVILPGVVALWPLLAAKWINAGRTRA